MTQTLEQLSAAATDAVKTTGDKYFGDYELSKDQWEAVDALVEFARVVTHQLRTGQLAEARDKALYEAANELERLDGFGEWHEAAQAIRALKSTKPPIL